MCRLTHCVVSVCQIYVADPVYIYIYVADPAFSFVGHLVSAKAKESCHDNPRWAHAGPRVYVHVRMRCAGPHDNVNEGGTIGPARHSAKP